MHPKENPGKKILLSIPFGNKGLFLWQVTKLNAAHHAAFCLRYFAGIFPTAWHGCEEMASSTNPFLSGGGNFVDGVYIIDIYIYIIYIQISQLCASRMWMYRRTVERFPTRGPSCAGPSGQVAWVHVFPAFRRAKISPGIASKMVSKGTWTSELPTKSFSRESIGLLGRS